MTTKAIAATAAKNNFGGLLDEIAASGRVNIMKHGRLVAVMLSPAALEQALAAAIGDRAAGVWGRTHMIPAGSARAAHMPHTPSSFDDEPV